MDSILTHQIKTAIDRLKENNFQDFLTELLIKKYGTKFTPTKQKRDKGCDGILNGRMVLAAYAPEKHTLNGFKLKTQEDHKKYMKNWKTNYPEWCLVYNGQFTAEMLQFLDGLDGNVQKWDMNHLLDIIQSIPWPKIREMSNRIGIDEQYIRYDIFKAIIDDLLSHNTTDIQVKIVHKKPLYIEDKIKLNYAKEDIENATKEYEIVLPYLSDLCRVLKIYSDDEKSSLKSNVLTWYRNLSGDFKTRLNNLAEKFSEENKGDDMYRFYVRVVLIYLFEACLIGKRAAEEKLGGVV